MMPVLPHLASECLDEMHSSQNISWPKINEKLLKKEKFTIVVQINGKKRDLLESVASMDENDVLEAIKSKEITKKYLNNKEIKKKIYIKNKLINLII